MHNKKICHLTSVHQRYDTRIFLKECISLQKFFTNVTFIVADGLGNEVRDGVKIIDVTAEKGRLKRIFQTTGRVYNKAKEVDADIYHFHDPELIPVGLKLKKLGKIVIYDSHEDVPRQILGKPYLSKLSRFVISKTFELYEKKSVQKLDAIITATPFIRDKFLRIHKNVIDINNFPILGELDNNCSELGKRNTVCYVGGLTLIRGILEIVKAVEYTSPEIKLILAGKMSDRALEEILEKEVGWQKVSCVGYLNRDEVKDLMNTSFAGLVTLHPLINYLDSLPIKMFEYMIAGIPVIASDFPLWKDIIEGSNCGLCVNPMKPKEIAAAIDYLHNNPEISKKMGENGKRMIYNKYNWSIEEEKLSRLYQSLICGSLS